MSSVDDVKWWHDLAVRKWAAAHPHVMDAALTALLSAYAVTVHLLHFDTDFDYRRPNVWTTALVVVTCAPLLIRRRLPEVAVVTGVGLQIGNEFLAINGTGWLQIVILVYSLGAYGTGRRRRYAGASVTVAILAILVLGVLASDGQLSAFDALGSVAVLTGAAVIGDNVRRRRREVIDLSQRAERAERERELLAARRVGEERARIARELHDVVAHSVSVMVIQASAAQRHLDRDAAATAGLLDNIETTGRQTMTELRHILGVLRTDELTAPPHEPVVGDLGTLATSLAGLDVEVDIVGDWEAVPKTLALQAYRIIQEALTNVHRHGGPGVRVRLAVDVSSTRLELRVVDDGRGASTLDRDGTEPGYGLLGMSERAAAFGGQLRSGPRRAGGWEVAAMFPMPAGYSAVATSPAPDIIVGT